MTTAKPLQLPHWLADSTGMIASIACAIHCAAMPLVISYLPMLGLSWLADEAFHQVMAVVCFFLAVAAFVPGWRKHGSLLPACVGSAGVAVIAIAAFTLEGKCCPTCAAGDESAAPTAATARLETANLACSDDKCAHCLAAPAEQNANSVLNPTAVATNTQKITTETAAAWWLPLITPIGGVFLIVGHLVNHRKSCACRSEGCCLPTITDAIEP